jgi:hypothetical protein
MALVNRKVNKKVGRNSRKLSKAIEACQFNAKYFENTEKMLKNTSIKRIIDSFPY